MKKIVFVVSMLFCTMAFANQPVNSINKDDIENNDIEEVIGTVKILSVSSTRMEMLVEFSDALNDFCNYFDDSWMDVGLSVYCAFTKTGVYGECIVYRAWKAMCAVNGAVRLYMEGDISMAIRKGLKAGAQIYSLTKTASTTFKLTESAMCEIDKDRN